MFRFVAIFLTLAIALGVVAGLATIPGGRSRELETVRKAETERFRLYGRTFARWTAKRERRQFRSEQEAHDWLGKQLAADRAKAEAPVNRILQGPRRGKFDSADSIDNGDAIGRAYEKLRAE